MIRKIAWIEDTLNDIKNIIFAEGENCDYESLIKDVQKKMKEIGELLDIAKTDEEKQKLKKLEEKAELYLHALNSYSRKNSKEEDAQPGNE